MPVGAIATGEASATPSQRIEGLCTWRALLMLGGVLLHATMGEESRPAFAAINIVSGSFRMGAFFAISGLLAGFALRRRTAPTQWLGERLVQIGVPTLFGIAVICPLTAAIFAFAEAGDHRGGSIAPNLYHLWFLVALLAYTPLAYALECIDRRRGLFDRIEQWMLRGDGVQLAMLLLSGALSLLLTAVAIVLVDLCVPQALRTLTTQARVAAGCVPLFVLGLFLARMPKLRDQLLADAALPTTVLTAAVAAYIVLWSPWMRAIPLATWLWWNDVLLAVTTAWCAPAATVLILRSAIAIRSVPEMVKRISDASLTIYILHYPVIAATKIAIAPLRLGSWSGYTIAVAAGAIAPYLLHVSVIRRSPLLMLLVNGRNDSTRAAGTGVAAPAR